MKDNTDSYFLIVDLEATCSDDGIIPSNEMEIIEIGAVMLNRATWEIDSEFQQFVQPVRRCMQRLYVSNQQLTILL